MILLSPGAETLREALWKTLALMVPPVSFFSTVQRVDRAGFDNDSLLLLIIE